MRPSTWGARLKWFASEFVVVVAGILVALALQAWWQDRQDAARSTEYRRQILSDVRATERSLRDSILVDRDHYAKTKLLSAALYASGIPTRNQAMQWLQSYPGWLGDARPVLGNVSALVQTGEIRVVSNPRVRRGMISYESIMETSWKDRDAQLERMVRANDLALARLEAVDLPPLIATPSDAGTYDAADVQGYVPAYLSAWPRLRADAEFRTAQQWRLFAYLNIAYYNQEMLSATTALRKVLETSGP